MNLGRCFVLVGWFPNEALGAVRVHDMMSSFAESRKCHFKLW